MITVTVGTTPFQFNRVINWLHQLLESRVITEPVFIQYGNNDISKLTQYPQVTAKPILEIDELMAKIDQSLLVISHAGQGATRALAARNVSFVLLPRLAQYGEHMDDHQLWFAHSVEPFGVQHCMSMEDLQNAILNPPPRFQGQLFKGARLDGFLIQRYPALNLAS